MAARGIDLSTFRYYPPNFAEDLRQEKPYILIETFSRQPTAADYHQTELQEMVIRANFQSKKILYRLGPVQCQRKDPLKIYHWTVIKVTLQALFNGFKASLKIALYLLVAITASIAMGYFIGTVAIVLIESHFRNINSLLTLLLLLSGRKHTIISISDYWDKNFAPIIDQAQKPYLDSYAVFQPLSQIPNSMEGFDTRRLANLRGNRGWITPLTESVILPHLVNNTQVLRIGKYAFPIIDALKIMLSTYCPDREIHHPVIAEHLSPEKKSKFLTEVSAFFGITDVEKLKTCWNQSLSREEINTDVRHLVSAVPYGEYLPYGIKTAVVIKIFHQCIVNKQKQAFLKLIPPSIAREYFGREFGLERVRIPNPIAKHPILILFLPLEERIKLYTVAFNVLAQSFQQ